MHSTQATWWCTQHSHARQGRSDVDGVGEAEWLADARSHCAQQAPLAIRRDGCRLCRFCPDRDAIAGDLCTTMAAVSPYARRDSRASTRRHGQRARSRFPAAATAASNGCLGRAESEQGLCLRHRRAWVWSRRPEGRAMATWLLQAQRGIRAPTRSFLGGLQPLLAAEIRYALWTHTKNAAPARWHPMWLRTLVKSCRKCRRGLAA